MKVLIAPNAMKGTLSAINFANAIEEGIKLAGIDSNVKLPIADGGDGSAQILAQYLNAQYFSCKVHDPLNREISSGFYLNSEKLGIIEMASASGLKLLKSNEYDAFNSSSFGTGELILQVIEKGAKKIILCIGGSATVDLGMGALMALGFQFYNNGHKIETGTGATMGDVTYIDTSMVNPKIGNVEITILCDVKNPLLGENGSVNTFAIQKGASSDELKKLYRNCSLFAGAIFQNSGIDVSCIVGGGAAGGIASSFFALLNAELVDGATFILNKVDFYTLASNSDVIITGEGEIDQTSIFGKGTGAILNFGMEIDKPVYAICGDSNLKGKNNFQQIIKLIDQNCSESNAKLNAYNEVVKKSEELGITLKNKYDR
ncbi:MAG: glycerate kinase [Prolixibacteraceae bacterium]|jgi:glycerate kinase|nr:glycerate kinase [Prolixibacteraceae bacterium]